MIACVEAWANESIFVLYKRGKREKGRKSIIFGSQSAIGDSWEGKSWGRIPAKGPECLGDWGVDGWVGRSFIRCCWFELFNSLDVAGCCSCCDCDKDGCWLCWEVFIRSSSIVAEVRALASPLVGGRKKTEDEGEIEGGRCRFPVDRLHFRAAGPFRITLRCVGWGVVVPLIFRRDHRRGFSRNEIRWEAFRLWVLEDAIFWSSALSSFILEVRPTSLLPKILITGQTGIFFGS